MYYKRKANGMYRLFDDNDNVILSTETVGVIIATNSDNEMWEILYHGHPYIAQSSYHSMTQDYIDAGYEDIAKSIYKIKLKDFNVDDFNKALSVIGYISLFLTNEGIDKSTMKCYAKSGVESIEARRLKDETENIHNNKHNEFTFWGNCKEEPCISIASKTVDNIYYQEDEKMEDMDGTETENFGELLEGVEMDFANPFSDVDDFINTFNQDKENDKRVPTGDLLQLRLRLIEEEWQEIQDAVGNDDLTEYVDGCLDLIYVTIGALLAAGISAKDSKNLWDMVHASNMAKAGGSKDENGKMLKPEGWKPPDIKGYLGSL